MIQNQTSLQLLYLRNESDPFGCRTWIRCRCVSRECGSPKGLNVRFLSPSSFSGPPFGRSSAFFFVRASESVCSCYRKKTHPGSAVRREKSGRRNQTKDATGTRRRDKVEKEEPASCLQFRQYHIRSEGDGASSDSLAFPSVGCSFAGKKRPTQEKDSATGSIGSDLINAPFKNGPRMSVSCKDVFLTSRAKRFPREKEGDPLVLVPPSSLSSPPFLSCFERRN